MQKIENVNETWKPIEGFSGYEVSSLGRVKSFRRYTDGQILKYCCNSGGYAAINLACGSKSNIKRRLVHRLVAIMFIPNPFDRSEVNHKDGIKYNNHMDNLEWCTRSENNRHAYWVLGRKVFRYQVSQSSRNT